MAVNFAVAMFVSKAFFLKPPVFLCIFQKNRPASCVIYLRHNKATQNRKSKEETYFFAELLKYRCKTGVANAAPVVFCLMYIITSFVVAIFSEQ